MGSQIYSYMDVVERAWNVSYPRTVNTIINKRLFFAFFACFFTGLHGFLKLTHEFGLIS
jgi:hypothetical protein